MQDSGQYSANTDARGMYKVASLDESIVFKSFKDSDIVKLEERSTCGEQFTESYFDM